MLGPSNPALSEISHIQPADLVLHIPPGFIIPLVLDDALPDWAALASFANLRRSLNKPGLFPGVTTPRNVKGTTGFGS